ncbi:PorV/PorQ family protein [bacterium]|nr:PorV/PorQ family protein [bacterium]
MRLLTVLTLVIFISAAGFCAGITSFPITVSLNETRALALGGAVITETGWSQGAMFNPATAADGGRSFSACYANHLVDQWNGGFNVSYPLFEKYTVGGYLTTFDHGEFDRTNLDEIPTEETFGASENLAAVFFAGKYKENLSYGGALKFIWGEIDTDKSSGYAVDLGITYDPNWERVKLGLAVRNLGKQISAYGSDTYPLPTETLIGLSQKLKYLPLTISTVMILSREDEGDYNGDFLPGSPGLSFGFGGEFAVQINVIKDPLQLRFGYRSRAEGLRVGYHNDMLAGTSYGIGIPLQNFNFDYTFVFMGALGSIHRFGLTGKL